MHHEPAATIIAKFGGIREVASIVDVNVHTVTKWRLSKDKGGTGGSVPHWHVPKLIAEAESRGVDLTYSDFFAPSMAAPSSDDGKNGADAPVCHVNPAASASPVRAVS